MKIPYWFLLSGVGAFVFAPVANYLIDALGWKCSNLIFAALCLVNILNGLVMRPLEAVNDLELQDMASEIQEAEERNKKLSVKNIDPLPTIGENDVFNEAEEGEEVPERNNNLSSSPVKSHIIRNMSLNLPAPGDRMSSTYLRPVHSILSMSAVTTGRSYASLQGVPEKISLSDKGAYLTKGHFFGTPGSWLLKQTNKNVDHIILFWISNNAIDIELVHLLFRWQERK